MRTKRVREDQGQAASDPRTPPLHPQAKLGNSSVSPNVGHLVLKYLCPAVRAVLEDGLKSFVLDVIIGQRKNTPWSVVEASTQLGQCCWQGKKPKLNSQGSKDGDLQLWLPPRSIHQGLARPVQQSQPVPRAHQSHHALQRLHPRPAQVSVWKSAAHQPLPWAAAPLKNQLPRLNQKG